MQRREDREDAVFVRPDRSRETLGNLELQHQGGVRDCRAAASGAQEHEENRRRDVVGQITCDADGVLTHQPRKVRLQHVGDENVRIGWKLRPELRREIPIDLDRRQLADARCQPQRERTGARTDLDETIARGGSNRVDDLVGPRGLEEMLREALPYDCSIDSPRQNFSSISSISSSLMPK
jgi:hypothetical protein